MVLRGIILSNKYLRHPNIMLFHTGFPFSKSEFTEYQGKNNIHFGFQKVDENEKNKKVYNLFETISDSYDMMNDIMSLGIHRLWKDTLVRRLNPSHGTRLLDMAGGTGDISFRFLKNLQQLGPNSKVVESHVTVCDINPIMLDVGKKRAKNLGLTDSKHISWICDNAENLTFESDTYCAYTTAFGLRNITRIDKALSEAYRVLKPGGRFLCLEFSQMDNAALQWLYDQYSFKVIPVLGQTIVGMRQPYEYLVESIRVFPNKDDLKGMIEQAGFRGVSYEKLTFGMCYIHSGFKI